MKVEQKCGIISRTMLNDAAISLTLEAGDMVRTAFRAPGQFVHIKCGHSRLLRRPISVCACQAGEGDAPDRLTVVFEVRGEGTAWLAGRREGQSLDVMGLLGNGFPIEREGRYLLVGGGIGVPPMLGCAQYAPGRCTAILGFRSGDRVMLEEQFRSVCSQVQVATDDGSYGFHGYVDALARRELEGDRGYDAVLACGPRPMLRNVARAAEDFGVRCLVSMEERMGCGVGACLVCACDMADGSRKHVCKDGPVFEAREVDWDA